MLSRLIFAALLLMPGAAMAQSQKPNDAQIAHITYTAGVLDIAAAKQALAKSGNAAVKSFAHEMVRDHQAVNDKALAKRKPESRFQRKSTQIAEAKGEIFQGGGFHVERIRQPVAVVVKSPQ